MLQRAWMKRGGAALCLLPLTALFALLVGLRRSLYRIGVLHSVALPVPVVVVGNITVGGSGKTPLVIYLVEALQARGVKVGVVSRGYGGKGALCEVHSDSDSVAVGDEPLLIKQRTGAPVFVGRDRVAAAREMLRAYPDCGLIIADDGLQHYRLRRDLEIAVLDSRGLMNGWLLPAGPLREPGERLRQVDALVFNTGSEAVAAPPAFASCPARFHMRLRGARFRALSEPARSCAATELEPLRLAAIAGIGHPRRFFDHLAGLGLVCSEYTFADHHRYRREELEAIDADALLMTEKDAVKCAGLTDRPIWVLPVSAELDPDLGDLVMEKLYGRPPA